MSGRVPCGRADWPHSAGGVDDPRELLEREAVTVRVRLGLLPFSSDKAASRASTQERTHSAPLAGRLVG